MGNLELAVKCFESCKKAIRATAAKEVDRRCPLRKRLCARVKFNEEAG